MQEVSPILEKEGVQASFEPHPGDFIEDSSLAVDVLKKIGNKKIGYEGAVSAIPFETDKPIEAATESLKMIRKYMEAN